MLASNDVNGKVRIVAPERVAKPRACELWLSAINQLGLHLLVDNNVAVVLPQRLAKHWVWLTTSEVNLLGVPTTRDPVDFDFDSWTDLAEIRKRFAKIVKEPDVITGDPAADSQLIIFNASGLDADQLRWIMAVSLRLARST